jgi:transposase-like protein
VSIVDEVKQVEAGEGVVSPRLPLAADGAVVSAAPAVKALLDERLLDEMVARVRADGARLTGPGSFLSELCKAVLERGLQAELGEHLGYDKHDPAGRGSGNSRNGTSPKTVQTEIGPIALDVPRDRAGTFTPVLVPKGERRLGGLSDVIISLYAGGMTVRDICHHLQRVYGTEVSPDTVSTVTDAVLEEVKAWQTRPLDEGRFLMVVANPS